MQAYAAMHCSDRGPCGHAMPTPMMGMPRPAGVARVHTYAVSFTLCQSWTAERHTGGTASAVRHVVLQQVLVPAVVATSNHSTPAVHAAGMHFRGVKPNKQHPAAHCAR